VNRYSVVGLSHKSAPTELREKLQQGASEDILESARELAPEVALISTCNRFEIYAHASLDPARAIPWMAERAGVPVSEISEHAFVRSGRNACKYLFFVASSLDSLVVGETQIRGQVKGAYKTAHESGTVGPYLHRLFQSALRVSKEIADTTGVGRGTVSVAGAAADLAERVFGTLERATVLVLGAGETAELLVHHFQGRSVGNFHILNRTVERAHDLAAQCNGRGGSLDELGARLGEADIVAAAVAGDEPLLRAVEMKKALRARRGRPIVALDVAVPRAIDPAIDQLDNVYRYDMDALSEVTRDALRHRRKDFLQCCSLIDGAVLRLEAGARAGAAADAIVAVERTYRSAAQAALDELVAKLPSLDPEGRALLQKSLHRLVSRLLHVPVRALRNSEPQEREAVRRVFAPGSESEKE
jgi:glutamyl-tRNA reductase